MSSPSVLSAIYKLQVLLTPEEKLKWLAILGFALCTSLLEVVTASAIVVFAQVLNEPTIGQKYLSYLGFANNLSPGRTVFCISLLVGIIYLVKNLIAAAEVFFQNFSIQKMNYHFKNKLLHRYAAIDYGFYLTRNSSYGVHLIGGDSDQIFSQGMTQIAAVLSESMIFICLISMIVYINPKVAGVIFTVSLILSIFVTKLLFPKFYVWGKRLQQTSIDSGQHLMQFFHAFKEIILLGKKEAFVNAYQAHSYQKARVQAIQTATNNLPRMGIEVLFVGLFVLTILYLCANHENPVQVIGLLGGYLYTGIRLMPGLNRIINYLNTFKLAIPAIERVHQEYISVTNLEHYVKVPDFKFEHSIVLKDVNFRYLNTNKDALSNINLEIKKGESIGIVGETGSGKSTLVDLILGLLRPSQGSILIDNKFPVNCYEWHQKIGYVPQAVYLTDDTIAFNIAFGEKNIDLALLNAVIDKAQLRKFVDGLANGVNTIVGERGVRLSGGERQRIAIARALYRQPEVLIFDEATSALDNETEARLMETIDVVSRDMTVIMIAHRVTTLRGCEKIVEINNKELHCA